MLDMRKLIPPISKRYSLILLLAVCVVFLLTLLTSFCLSTPLPGISSSKVEHLDGGWAYENGGMLTPIDTLPCRLSVDSRSLKLVHEFPNISNDTNKILTFYTRYASIRVWADDILIYEAAQGQEHALSSMWHFIPLHDSAGASQLLVELTRYESGTYWDLHTVLLDHPDAVRIHLLCDAAPALFFALFCLLFTLLLLFVALFMAGQKIRGTSSMLALAAFIFLSGMWILLDSKITTIFGGNYALSYFFSYAAFYLLMIPYLLYIQLMLDSQTRIIRYLPLVFAGNAGVCMLLHLLGVIPIRKTAFTVHVLILLSLLVSTREFWHSVVKRKEKKLFYTFCGTLLIYAAGLISIILYYIGALPPTNSAVLFSWGLLILILCAAIDAFLSFGYFWKQKQYLEHYQQMAVKDSMTMLGNRNAFELYLQELAGTSPGRLVFILFDLDKLKFINDTYGHTVGDQVIHIAAQCIRKVFEPVGTCYRVGGDEFCVILTSAANNELLLHTFETQLHQKSEGSIPFSVSYGWSEKYFGHGMKVSMNDIFSLQKLADENLYRHKKGKRDVAPSD